MVELRAIMGLLERQIEDILFLHPYLIKEGFSHGKRQVVFEDNSRADIVFFFEKITYILELKKDIVSRSTVDQIIGYINNLIKEHDKKVKGIIIGKKPVNPEDLIDYGSKKGYEIGIKYLDIDIPTRYKLCREKRHANPLNQIKCKYCKCDKWVSAYLSD